MNKLVRKAIVGGADYGGSEGVEQWHCTHVWELGPWKVVIGALHRKEGRMSRFVYDSEGAIDRCCVGGGLGNMEGGGFDSGIDRGYKGGVGYQTQSIMAREHNSMHDGDEGMVRRRKTYGGYDRHEWKP